MVALAEMAALLGKRLLEVGATDDGMNVARQYARRHLVGPLDGRAANS